ncbi:UNVERIFIED_CONTAM: hypothetical protein NCL1_02751 [Trichonephila clavipes]
MGGTAGDDRNLPRVADHPVGFRSGEYRHAVHGRRRHLGAVRHADHLPHAADHCGLLDGGEPHQGIHDRLPAAGDADARRVLCAGSGAVLPVLRGRPDPDVPDHRCLGRPAPHLRCAEVLPVHLPRLGADAGGDGGDVCRCGHHRHRATAEPHFRLGHAEHRGHSRRGRYADAAVPCLLRQLRGENADVAGAYLAARCPRSGADRRVGGSGGDPAEDGWLRLPALLAADVPGGRGCDVGHGALDVGHRHRLYLAGGAGAERHEEADRLFLGRAHGLRHHGHLRGQPAGDRRRHLPDAVARFHLGRAVPVRRRDL